MTVYFSLEDMAFNLLSRRSRKVEAIDRNKFKVQFLSAGAKTCQPYR